MPDDIKKLQGTWNMTSLEINGALLPNSAISSSQIIIDNDHFTAIGMGAIYEGKFINAEEAQKLAQLPSKEELYGKLVWLLNYPVSGFVNVLAGNLRKLLYALNAIKEKKPA